MRKLFIKYFPLVLSIAFAFLATWPLFHPGLIPTHDGEYHLVRFYEFDKMMRLGYWYPRWAPDLFFGYGLPLFTYVYPLPNYVASFFHIFGISFLDSVKYNMILATLIGAALMYLWTKEFWGKLGGLVSSVFYTFVPYHFVDIYVRGSVGEVWALALFPGFLWTYTLFIKTKKVSFLALASIFLALTIFSHNILGLMFFVFAITYCIFFILQNKEKKYFIFRTIFLLLLSLGLSSIFWLPALTETNYVTGLQIYNIAQNFPDLFQLLFPSWGTGFFDINLTNQMSVQIGTANLLVIIGTLFLLFRKRSQKSTLGFYLGWFVILFLLMLPFTLPVWLHIPLLHYFQFPWRLLSLVILLCAFLAGGLIRRKPKLIAPLLILFAVATTFSYTQPAYYMLRSDTYYTSQSNFIDGTNSPGNSFNTVWNSTKDSRSKERFPHQENIIIENSKVTNPVLLILTEDVTKTTKQIINLSYFPGWKVKANGKQLTPFSTNGLLSFTVPKGKQIITIAYGQTIIETIAMGMSIASVLLIILLLLRKRI